MFFYFKSLLIAPKTFTNTLSFLTVSNPTLVRLFFKQKFPPIVAPVLDSVSYVFVLANN